MYLKSLSLFSFRNHKETELSFLQPINVFFGKNGQGKTNLLDSIHFLCLTKSFLVSQDSYCIQSGEKQFGLIGKFISDSGLEYLIKVSVDSSSKKEFVVNNDTSYSQLDMIGMIPTVIMTLDDRLITMGGPADRRKFLDSVLYQISKSYIQDSKKLKRIVRQRNDVLSSFNRNSVSNLELYEAWTDELIEVSIPIMKKRVQFLTEFNTILAGLYKNDFARFEIPEITYLFNGREINSEIQFETEFADLRKTIKQSEFDRGMTLFGPHRDDLLIKLDNKECRYFSSQGQHKLLLLALKFSMWFYIREKMNENPLFLIDDIFSELDQERMELISGFLPNLGQTFITATDRENFQSKLVADFFEIESGRVK